MQGKDLIFCLQDKDFNFWAIEDNAVIKTATPYFLSFSPSGWQDVGIQNIRNKKYWGIDRTVTVPLAYVKDGAKILKHIFYTKGIEENVYLCMASLQLEFEENVSYGFWYKQIFRGEIDLSKFDHFGPKVTASCLEDGLSKFLKANEGTEYEFPVNVPEAVTVKMDGINLHESLNYQPVSGVEIERNTISTNFFAPILFLNNEGDSTGLFYSSQTMAATPSAWADKLKSDNYLIKNIGGTPITINVTGKVEFKCTKMVSSPAYALKLRFLTSTMPQDVPNQDRYKIIGTPSMAVGKTYSEEFSLPITLAPNEALFLEGVFFGGVGSNAGITFTENNNFKFSFITRHDATYIKALPGQYLFKQLIDKVTEGSLSAALSPIMARYNNIVFTSGNAIRGLDEATVKVKFSDFFKFWDSFSSVGLSEKDRRILLDQKELLIDPLNKIVLKSFVSGSFKVSVASDYLFNELQIGYPEIKNDVGVLNGNEEFNSKFIFSLGTTKSPGVLDKMSPIKSSPYEIEKIRVTTLEKNTTDYKADNDLFALMINLRVVPETPEVPAHHLLDRSLNATATGLIEPGTVFNIGLSPKRMLLNNGSFIRSSLYLSDHKTLEFISADKNDKMVANGLVEKENENIGGLGSKYFFPILFNFEVDAPHDLEDMLDINPLQLFEFYFEGNSYDGILQKVSMSPSSQKTQSFELLSYASNNLQKLIDYNG